MALPRAAVRELLDLPAIRRQDAGVRGYIAIPPGAKAPF
jgi:hypothetical protein